MLEEARIPEKHSKTCQKEVGEYTLTHGTQAVIKVFSKKYPTIQFNRTFVNYKRDKSKSRPDGGDYKNAGRPNILDDALLLKVKDIALGIRISGVVINRQQLINIGNGVIRANNPEILKEFGGTNELTEDWARSAWKSLNWSKRRATTGKVEPTAQLLAEEVYFSKSNSKNHPG